MGCKTDINSEEAKAAVEARSEATTVTVTDGTMTTGSDQTG